MHVETLPVRRENVWGNQGEPDAWEWVHAKPPKDLDVAVAPTHEDDILKEVAAHMLSL